MQAGAQGASSVLAISAVILFDPPKTISLTLEVVTWEILTHFERSGNAVKWQRQGQQWQQGAQPNQQTLLHNGRWGCSCAPLFKALEGCCDL